MATGLILNNSPVRKANPRASTPRCSTASRRESGFIGSVPLFQGSTQLACRWQEGEEQFTVDRYRRQVKHADLHGVIELFQHIHHAPLNRRCKASCRFPECILGSVALLASLG